MVLSPESLAESKLVRDVVLSRLVKPWSAVGLRGTLGGDEDFLACLETVLALGDPAGPLPPRWKRSIQDEAEDVGCRAASIEESVDEDQRERNVLSGIVHMEVGGVGVVGEREYGGVYIPATGLCGNVGSVEQSLLIGPVSISNSNDDIGEVGSWWCVTIVAEGEYADRLCGVTGTLLEEW